MKINSSVAANSYLLDAVTNNIDQGASVRSFSLHSLRSIIMKLMMVVIMVGGWNVVMGETVTYTITSTSTVSTSGTAPAGSSATFNNTYISNKQQITKNNSMTLTLSGYAGCKITSITLSMHSNGSGGAGNFSMSAGTTPLSSISSAAFNTSSWHGSYTTSFVDVTPNMTNSNYVIQSGENVVITIAATTNSLYCQYFTINYEPSVTIVPYSVSFSYGTGRSSTTPATASLTEASAGAGITLPSATAPAGCDPEYTFYGWATLSVSETTIAPSIVGAAGQTYHPSGNITLYAVYKQGSETYQLVENLSAITEGIYYLLTTDYHAFNGTISSGHGQIAENAFSFTGGYATVAPSGAIELTLTASSSGFTMYNSAYGYLYASAASSGHLAWHNTENSYWKNSNSNWTYNSNNAYLRSYSNNSFRTYGANNGDVLKMAKKGGVVTYSTNPSCTPPSTATITYNANGGSGNMAQQTVDIGDYVTISANGFTAPTEKHFLEWNTAANGSGTSYSPGDDIPLLSSMTLFAIWETNTYNVVWYVSGASIRTRTYDYGSSIPEGDVPADPTSSDCDGKTFVGWSTTEVDETDVEPPMVTIAGTTVNGAMNFYAVFAEASVGGSAEYTKVTSSQTDWTGKYLIAYDDETFMNGALAGGTYGIGAGGASINPGSNLVGNTINVSWGDAHCLEVVSVAGGYVMKTLTGDYIYQTSNANGLASTANLSTADDHPLAFSFISENNIAISIANLHPTPLLHYNTNQSGFFRFYQNGGQEAIYMYKRGGVATYSAYSTSCVPCEADPAISSTALNFSDITSSSVTVEAPGGITSFGVNCHIRSYGFVYGTSANPTLASGTVAVAGTSYTTINSSFNKVIDGLSPCTTYHVRAYATNGHGTVYGSDCTFTTGSDAEIAGLISVNGETSATLYWNLIGELCVSGHYVVICRQGSSDIASSCSNYDFTSITANAAFGSGTLTSTGEYAVYSGSETSVAITNLTSGSTYTAAVFYVDDSGNCLLREQITFEYISITLLEPGDLAIVGVDYNIGNNIEGIYFSGDEISFVIFKSIKKGTTIEITDNGYERKFPGLWGTSEGILRFTWNGNSVLPEGSFITIMTRRDDIKSNNNLNDSIAIYVNNERSLNWQFSFEGNDFGFNDEDQIWIMQGGEWIEDLSVDVSGADGDHKHNMKYTGNVLYGFTATGWMSTYGYDLPKGSTLYPGCECFMTDITFNPGGRVKYKGTISGERSKYEWIGLMNDISNWEKFTSTENYHNLAVHNYTAISTPLRISHSVPTTNEWAGYKDNSWCNCANWYYLIVPDRNTDVTIPEITSHRNIVNIPANDIVECKNLTIEEGGSLSSNASNAEMSVYGNLVVQSGGQLSLANTNPMTLKLNGNLSNGGNFTTYRGLSMDLLSASAQNIDDVSSGDFALNNLTFRADGNTFDAATIKLYGNLNDQSPSNNGLGTQEIHFVGDAQQTINNTTAISNVTINNTSDAGVVVASGKMLNVSADARFVDGVVNGNVTFAAAATSSGASTSSYVDGTVTKVANASAFTFPTGSNGVLGALNVTTLGADTDLKFNHAPDGFSASQMPVWWNQNNMCGPNEGNARFDHVTNMYFWNLGTSATIADAVFSVSADDDVHFNSETIEHDNADIDMAIYDGCWKNLGGTASTSDPYHLILVSDVDLPATRAGGDKVVTFGSIDHNTLLPIELTAFSAECNGSYAKISWSTATERNNDYFVLERSDDAISFDEIARLAGAGSSINPIDYTYIDNNVHGGDIFYRLVQVDYDGTRSVSEIIAVNCAIDADGEPEMAVYPNPFANDLTLHFENFGDRVALVEVYDMLGRMLVSRKVACSQNDYEFVLPLGGLPDGAYNVRVSAEDVVINRQVVKNR